jgi:hypothetical protein
VPRDASPDGTLGSASRRDATTVQRTLRFDAEHRPNRPAFLRLAEFNLGRQTVAVLEQHESDKAIVQERWKPYAHLDLLEPFDRIREALTEAQRGVSK